jgi:hypothetical protein
MNKMSWKVSGILIKTDVAKLEIVNEVDIYQTLDVTCVTLVTLNWGELYVDDEGLLREESLSKGSFMVNGCNQRLYGRGLIINKFDISAVIKNVRFF